MPAHIFRVLKRSPHGERLRLLPVRPEFTRQKGRDRASEASRKHADDPLWYKDAIIYEVHVRAFMDSNNDGIGDFPGLMQKLDYLQDLGVTCLWLLPFFPSPLRDDGYDISDYMSVHPSYGTLDDFKAFLNAAHERGLQVMIELVMNHTSDQHPWFQRARNAPAGSPERDFYVWSDTDQKYKDARIIFTDTEKSNWTWDPVAQAYFWHRFFSHQPDLNYDNPRVLEEVLNVMRFWLDMGVDGAAHGRDSVPGGARRNQLRESAGDARGDEDHPRGNRCELCEPHDSGGSEPMADRRAPLFRRWR